MVQTCEKCGAVFGTAALFERHQKLKISCTASLRSCYCGRQFVLDREYDSHRLRCNRDLCYFNDNFVKIRRAEPRTWRFGEESYDCIQFDLRSILRGIWRANDNYARYRFTSFRWHDVSEPDPIARDAIYAVLEFDRHSASAAPSGHDHTAFEHDGVAWVWTARGKKGEWMPAPVDDVASAMFQRAARAFAMAARELGPGPFCWPDDLTDTLVDYLMVPKEVDERDVLTPAAAAHARGEGGKLIFMNRSQRARRFYLGPVTGKKEGPCGVECGCSRGAARRVLLDA